MTAERRVGALALAIAVAAVWHWCVWPAAAPARQPAAAPARQPAAASGATVAAGTPPAPAAAGARSRAVAHQDGVRTTDAGVARGAARFAESCASCHGLDAEGITGRAPSLRGVGAGAIDFYLSTGRMPLATSGIEPLRSPPRYDQRAQSEISSYLQSLAPGGPPVPVVNVADGDVARGRQLFTSSCSGCHQIAAQGGVAPGLTAPPLDEATPVQIAEAIRTGPYLMPRFGPRTLDGHDVDSIARYVTTYGRHPTNRGGWGIGNIGPIPEGLVAWLLAAGSLVVVARIIGTRST